jgi:hypothetical protein
VYTTALEQVGTLLSGALGRFGQYLLGNIPIMTCQSPIQKHICQCQSFTL